MLRAILAAFPPKLIAVVTPFSAAGMPVTLFQALRSQKYSLSVTVPPGVHDGGGIHLLPP